MKGVEPFSLAGVRGPCLAAIQQGAEDAGIVHGHLRRRSQLGLRACFMEHRQVTSKMSHTDIQPHN